MTTEGVVVLVLCGYSKFGLGLGKLPLLGQQPVACGAGVMQWTGT